MKTVVYLDILLLVNFLIGYFLLRAAARLAGADLGAGRALAGAAASALSTLILLAPELPSWLGAAYKLATAAAIVLIAFGYKGWRPFLRACVWFFILNLGLAGLVLLAVYQGGFSGMQVNNFSVYINLSPVVLLLAVLCMYLLIRLLLALFGRPGPENLWRLQFALAGAPPVELQAFYDTGFFLQDPLSGCQALLVSWPGAKNQLPAELNDFLREYFSGGSPLPPAGYRLRLVPCKSAAGQRALPGFIAASAALHGGRGAYGGDGATVVFTDQSLRDGQFQALFGSEFLHSETKRRKSTCTKDG